ncbi:hypothetical protein CONCODRAFT_79001 [Conidiobolus coronatus NRRL 28638]|uniref:Uncharacterized protein n=1 Tax=Conidiobolus coronatus (strain ATCC 28846 / CBS 209.66 / NRRL 28638) TaxID=796925 RepID=A0A137P4Y9_CONC2|nr:hypothetical protein CONCODRAFT_79001 [Conidiobolus coronatus NRRL 28638]|eukprot:KXN70068.1 hypothetical protein CONCODRAFT_79001 [Conidiobolus coronatus NRRL 28638]
MSTINTDLKIEEPNNTSNKTNKTNKTNMTNKKVVNNVIENEDSNLENKSKASSSTRKKLMDLHIVCFKKYLEENKHISPTEAMDRVIKDTGLEIGYSSVQKTLLKLKKEMGIVANKKGLTRNRSKKLKDTDFEHLKSYLKENKYITYEQAKNRLHEETGLVVSVRTIGVAIKILREELGLEFKDLSPLGYKSNRPPIKLKDTHMEYLKKYLKEDIYIGNTEAMNRLYQDTGLKLSVTPVRHALIKLEEEIRNEEGELSSSESVSKTASKTWAFGLKLKKLHIECLKKYINENGIISANEATRRLQNETGLEVSYSTVGRVLAILKNSNQGSIETSLPISTSKVRSRAGSYNFKLQDQHMECLKRYLNENNSINLSEARKKLFNETGLKVSDIAIRNAFLELKEHADLDKSQPISNTKITLKQWNFGRKLKDNHIECLKKYLNEDIYIGSTVARNRLHDETGLEISIYPIQLALAKLKREMIQDENVPQPSISRSKVKARIREFGYKVKDIHIECLKKYLREDEFIHFEVAGDKLAQETGLKLSGRYIRKVLSKLKEEVEQSKD